MTTASNTIPDHVPPELVTEFPLILGSFSKENPWQTLVPQACEGPPASYARGIYPGEGGAAWLFRRKEDVNRVFFDTEHFSNRGWSSFARFIGETWNQVPTEMDPPDHTMFRVALNPLFSPPRMKAMEDDLRRRARNLIDTFKDKGECQLMTDFAFPFPVAVVLDMMNLPQDRLWDFQKWEHGLLHSGKLEVMQEATRNVVDYLREVIAERKQNPGDDLISAAIKSEVDGRKWTDDELVGYGFNLFIGGLDTVTANIGNQVRYLAENPDAQNKLRENPELVAGAVEEFMRVFAAVTTFRVCVKETEIAGVTVKPGDKIAMCTTVAGRDPEAYENPHEVRLDRKATHLSFAVGPHFCLGVHLARRELRIALEELLAALPEFRIKPGEIITSQVGGIIQPTTLPLVW
ncbi:MAG: cytochrome [Porticoccaceae bacterium]|nr:cytochrome [Porticoccaceae bacterium]